MKRSTVFLLALICLASIASVAHAERRGLLWKISGNNLERPSYIFGTCHYMPKEFIDSVKGLRQVVREVDAVYGELEDTGADGTQIVDSPLYYAPADSVLDRLLTPSQAAKVDSLYCKYKHLYDFSMVDLMSTMQYCPAMFMLACTEAMLFDKYPIMATGECLDTEVQKYADAQGKTIGGLETEEFQIRLLFGNPISVQLAELIEYIDNTDLGEEQIDLISTAYMAQDYDALAAVVLDPKYESDPSHTERVLFSRNRDWISKMPAIMAEQPTLFVVGSGHLVGDQGVLNLLRDKNFSVEPYFGDE